LLVIRYLVMDEQTKRIKYTVYEGINR